MSVQSEFIIDQLGGNKDAAEFFGVTVGAISQWKGGDVPPARMLDLLRRRPEIFWAAQKLVSGETALEDVA